MSDIFTNVEVTNVDAKLDDLVGEGKRFADANALLKGKLEADAFIQRLQAEAEEMRKQIGKAQTLDEIMTQIKAANPTPPVPAQPLTTPEKPDADPAKLTEIVSDLFAKRDAEARIKANRDLVEKTLREKWGADANLNLNKRASELGVTVDYLRTVANDSPAALFEILGVNRQAAPAPTPAAPRGVHVPPSQVNGRDQAFYENLKRTNPSEYFSPKVQNQMYKDLFAAFSKE